MERVHKGFKIKNFKCQSKLGGKTYYAYILVGPIVLIATAVYLMSWNDFSPPSVFIPAIIAILVLVPLDLIATDAIMGQFLTSMTLWSNGVERRATYFERLRKKGPFTEKSSINGITVTGYRSPESGNVTVFVKVGLKSGKVRRMTRLNEAQALEFVDLARKHLGVEVTATGIGKEEEPEPIMKEPGARKIPVPSSEDGADNTFCIHCGAKLDNDSRFCGFCGGKQL